MFINNLNSSKFIGVWVVILFFDCVGLCSAQNAINYSARIMVAGKHSYTSVSAFSVQGDVVSRTVSFYDLGKKLIRKEIAQYKTHPLEIISIKLEDYRSGWLETVQKHGNSYQIKVRKTSAESLGESRLTASPTAFSTSLMVQFLQQRFDALVQGKEQKFEMVLASRSMIIEMLATKDRTETIQDIPCVVIKTDLTSVIYRAFAEPSYFYFEQAAPHRLIYYKGILPLPDDKGNQISGATSSTY